MKTVCIYHSVDLDGWMSAAIVKQYGGDGYKGAAGFVTNDLTLIFK